MLCWRHPCLALLQDLDNLALREPRLSHGRLLGPGKSTVEVSTGGGSLRASSSSMRPASILDRSRMSLISDDPQFGTIWPCRFSGESGDPLGIGADGENG